MELFKNVSRSPGIEFCRNAAFYRAEIGRVTKKDGNNIIAFVPVEKVTSDQGESALLHNVGRTHQGFVLTRAR